MGPSGQTTQPALLSKESCPRNQRSGFRLSHQPGSWNKISPRTQARTHMGPALSRPSLLDSEMLAVGSLLELRVMSVRVVAGGHGNADVDCGSNGR